MNLSQYTHTPLLIISFAVLAFILLGIFSVLLYKADSKNDTKSRENISFILITSFLIVLVLFIIVAVIDMTPRKEAKAKFAADIKAETGYTISEDSADQILGQCNSDYYSDNIIATGKDGSKVALTYIIEDKKLNLFLAGQPLLKDEKK